MADVERALTAFICCLALLVRYATSLHPYSGAGTPPMYGDYEAHRHWMEVTVNLPVREWYSSGADNDLQYWGIDYPPGSAYLSWAVGQVAARTYPQLVALHTSRGHESAPTKLLMRSSVFLADVAFFFPAALALAATRRGGCAARRLALGALLLQPALWLVDHGHFQYNCVSLGLALGAQALVARGALAQASLLFCLSLNFKQMSLYYAPAFFCHMLGVCLGRPTWRARAAAVAALGATVLCTFALCWAPFLAAGWPCVRGVLERVFPVQRHLFEDKVANIWCALSVLPPFKLRATASAARALRLSLGAVCAALVLPCASMLRRPGRRAFELGTVSCALSFFLLSFQVHEKHVLLPLLPAGAALAADSPLLLAWLSAVSCFSMYPLLARDGLALAYTAALMLLAALGAAGHALAPAAARRGGWVERALRARADALAPLVACSVGGMAALHAAEALVAPPPRYPDLFPYLFCTFACAHFALALLALQTWHASHLLGWEAEPAEPDDDADGEDDAKPRHVDAAAGRWHVRAIKED